MDGEKRLKIKSIYLENVYMLIHVSLDIKNIKFMTTFNCYIIQYSYVTNLEYKIILCMNRLRYEHTKDTDTCMIRISDKNNTFIIIMLCTNK